jgi:TonB family protein
VGGVSQADCLDRPEVRAYYESIRSRMFERWVLPSGISGTHAVTLRFRLDAAGSATSVELVSSENSALGQSAVDALRSASPFPPMGDRVRCLAGSPVVGKFKTIPELGG